VIRSVVRSVIRISAFVRKEVVDVLRQPMLLLALVVGPFLILLAFGTGLREEDPQLRAVLVAPPDTDIREQVEDFAEAEREGERLLIEGVTSDESAARRQLRSGEVELVIVFPDDVAERIEANERAVISIHHDQIDPVEGQAIALFGRSAVDEINNRLLETVVAEFQDTVVELAERVPDEVPDPGVERYTELDPAIVVSPFRGETQLLAGQPVDLTDFYAPAVVVVLLQHLAITMLGLSIVRERTIGATELFKVSPMSAMEYVLGKFAAYLLMGGVVGAVLLAALIHGLGLPMAGAWWQLVVTLGALLFTSIAVGLTVAMVANSDSQAVQYAMLILLGTIFLSGFLLSLDRFLPFARPLSWVLPATHAIALMRDVMLRGAPLTPVVLGGLVAYGVVFAFIGTRLAKRRMVG
jgi:ABC-2 type transport system permease protein